MAHHCKAFILHCMDFRLAIPMKEFLAKEELLGTCDVVSVAGGVKDLISPDNPSDRDFILKQIDISANLHGAGQIIISNHTDCGAYGGSGKFASFNEERSFHTEEMKKAKAVIASKYPQLEIRMILGKISASGEVSLEEIQN